MKKLLFLSQWISILVSAQNKGIRFEQDITWEQVKIKAKTENKYVFVDCYATWCGPCKAMDKFIYPNDTVGNYMNDKFVSVKIQLDSSKNDNEQVKQWYANAHVFQQQYKVSAFPTYFFFSPDGQIVHKDLGLKNVNEFLLTVNNALDPDKQYFTLLENYQQNKKDFAVMPYLAKTAKMFDENSLALTIAADYMHNFLDKLSEDNFCTKTNLNFISFHRNMVSSKDKVFDLFYHHAGKVDEIMENKGYAQRFLDYIITNEEILDFITKAENGGPNPDWRKISKTIKNKYGSDYAARNVLNIQPGFYKYKKDWKNYTKYLVQQVEKSGIENVNPGMYGAMYLNNNAWAVFQHSNNNQELMKALRWSERAVQMDTSSNLVAGNIDTKANILYKLGMKEEAILLEEKVVLMSQESGLFQDTLDKMKKGSRTW